MTTIEAKHYDNYNGGGCRIYEDGKSKRKWTATGCGYDREGTAIADWFFDTYQEEIRKFFAEKVLHNDDNYVREKHGFYGVWREKDGQIYMDGGTGLSNVRRVMEQIGYKLTWLNIKSRMSNYYTIEKVKA